MNQGKMIKPALISGIILGIVSVSPFISALNCFCCAWVIAAGIFAAHLYVKSSPLPVTLGSGVVLGLLTGIIGAIVDTLFSIPLQILMRGFTAGIFEQVRQGLERAPTIPPAMRAALESILAKDAGIGIVFIIIAGVFNLIIFGLVGMLGGALGVALCEKRKLGPPAYPADASGLTRPAYEPPSPPPPPEDPSLGS